MIQNMYLKHRTLYGPWLISVFQTFNKRKFIKQRKNSLKSISSNENIYYFTQIKVCFQLNAITNTQKLMKKHENI